MAIESLQLDSYVDVLKDRHRDGDFFWVTRKWECPQYRFGKKRSPKQITEDVLNDYRVEITINELSKERGVKRDDVVKEATNILEEMSHNYQLRAIRFFGYILAKSAKRLYSHIYVNADGAYKIKSAASKYPMLFMPTHRSYADFLLVSYLCFHFDLPVPVIAAGLDFLGLKAVSMLLRNSGAFFIRRQFGDDRLYWVIFLVYVQTHILGGEAPIEFFVEGTRSRTAKSLLPKLGLLQVASELFFTARVPDITVVPISITYDRTLEEILYAYELMGVPKPKESTRGLLKARKVLQQNFGNVYIHLGDPLSLREFCSGKIDRSLHNLEPRFQCKLNNQEQVICKDIARHVIKTQQRHLIFSPFPLICLVVGHTDFKHQKLSRDTLFVEVDWLTKLLISAGINISYKMEYFPQSIDEQLQLHSNILHCTNEGYLELVYEMESARKDSSNLRVSPNILKEALPNMLLYHYGNQALQLLVPCSMVATCLFTSKLLIKDVIFNKYVILWNILSSEFVFERNAEEDEFNFSVKILQEEGIITESGADLAPIDFRKVKFLAGLLLPFLQCYAIVCREFLNKKIKGGTSKEIAHSAQSAIEIALQKGEIDDFKSLSLDMINNCINCISRVNALKKEKINGNFVFIPISSGISELLCDIELFLPESQRFLAQASSSQSKI